MMPLSRRTIVPALALILLSAGAVLAHHGYTGQYDTSRPILLGGSVTRTTFAPPHPVISVRVDLAEVPALDVDRPDEITGRLTVRPEDVGAVREIELSPVRDFFNLSERIRIGDRVMVVALMNCRPPHQLRSSWIQLSDGEIISYTRGLHQRADGCG
ncbi:MULTISPECIES: DUF6152 family protein [unclassified Chelatococcus]|uniref:DUF6152 family protein n=1 Tax=unclassified Chelatococcus TaxID=2638111 RepID=UPI001BD1949D|nr:MULTISPECIES: DUF6152 family protein [unclassified Chelatococcus]CAH1672877.1 conserved exported hypothetical protein [Hyphomicrobiales bacterium]MBS7738894.1 hypothetical protein [Chelatococcus sp. HY11]MBX3547046.1 hypothetical protein [Chelatococcus sp.]MCO5076577.1 DUF6152 family protein [Chelatococcus sp.]CAH1674883.1 conserved exported hypothetical protein [Hyphomicrobiales bacterium]